MSNNNSTLTNTKGIQLPKDAFVVIVKSEWNATVVNKLEEGCIAILQKHEVAFKQITVPGAFEMPFAIKNHWERTTIKPYAYITIGCVLRGGTPHFEYVCNAITNGVLQLNLTMPVPVIFGVLTLENQRQADERTGGIHGHKGEEAAITALKMINLIQQF